jgi:amino acid transporter
VDGQDLNRVLGFWSIVGAGVGLVVATTTLVSDLNGWAIAGPAFLVSLLLGFLINLAVGLSFSELSTAFPRAGQIYEYSRDAFGRGRDYIATGVGTAYFAAMIFVFMAEISAGGNAMSEVTGGTPLWVWIVGITLLAVVPNVVGIQLTAWVEIAIVAVMLAIRYLFGLVGFLGLSQSGDYDWGIWGDFAPFGAGAIVTALALAFWSFVGIEFVTPLVEETRHPERNMPRGIVASLVIILVTSLVMGLGIIGAVEPGSWTTLAGNAPQIPVGEAMLGTSGGYLMALASFLATLASINVGLAAIPRIIYAMARDGLWPRVFARVHPTFRTPYVAVLGTVGGDDAAHTALQRHARPDLRRCVPVAGDVHVGARARARAACHSPGRPAAVSGSPRGPDRRAGWHGLRDLPHLPRGVEPGRGGWLHPPRVLRRRGAVGPVRAAPTRALGRLRRRPAVRSHP